MEKDKCKYCDKQFTILVPDETSVGKELSKASGKEYKSDITELMTVCPICGRKLDVKDSDTIEQEQ